MERENNRMDSEADYRTEKLFSKETVHERVAEMGRQISRDYQGKNPLFVGVLKGSFVFMADLIREIETPIQVDFVRVSSYKDSMSPLGKPCLVLDLGTPIEGRDVLLIDDIVDTGHSLSFLYELFKTRNPASLKTCTLLDKPCRREEPFSVDYVGFEIPDLFVVGYGIDYAEHYRNLKEICSVVTGPVKG